MEVLSDSGNSSCIYFPSPSPAIESYPADVEALRRLSDNLSSLFRSASLNSFSDLFITVGSNGPDPPRDLAVHRCIVSARSPFFREFFSNRGRTEVERLELGEILRGFEVGFEALELVMGYVYSGKVGQLPKGVCECADEECPHVACRPAVDFMVQVLFASFSFEISELVSLFQRHLLGILEKVTIDDIPVILSVANLCSKACSRLLTKCIEIVVNSDLEIVTLEKVLPPDIVKHTMDLRSDLGLDGPEGTSFPDMHVKRIYKALDSDDIELVKLLLEERHTTLDDAYALHYAVAHCNSKVKAELLNLGLADVNHKNLRGYNVLHIAAMCKEPEIMVSLLTKGARPFDLTSDGKKAIQISKRVTKAVDFYKSIERCKASPKGRLCIEILEQAERSAPLVREASISFAMGDPLQNLLYLENRVGLAKLLYPVEAKVAMVNAHVDGTLEFTSGPTSYLLIGNQSTAVLNEIPFKIKEEHLSRMRALSKTVELGMLYFPRCSEVLNKIMADDVSEHAYLELNNTEWRRKRFLEVQDEMMKAFLEDKEFHGSVLHSSSSKVVRRVRTKSAKKC